MAITTLEGLAAASQSPYSFYKTDLTHTAIGTWVCEDLFGTVPAAMTAPASGVNGEALTATIGLPFPTPTGGENVYLSQFSANASHYGILMLCDRLWQNSGLSVTSTSAQPITPVAIPARDANGATDGVGVMVGIETTTATSGAPIFTISYTNSSGTAGRTATITNTTSRAKGTFQTFALQTGDVGVRSVESYTGSSSMSVGAISLVLYRPLAMAGPDSQYGESLGRRSALQCNAVRMYDNTVPMLLWNPASLTATNISGEIAYAVG